MRWLALACGAVALAFGAGARADPSPAEQAVADLRFREGRALMAEKKIDAACAKFAESAKLFPRPGTLLNLASCHEAQGKIASAWAEYGQALAGAGKERRADRQQIAKERMAALEPALSWLTIEAPPGSDAGVTVRRDGEPLGAGALGVALPVDPGPHVITVEAPGEPAHEVRVTVGDKGDRQVVKLPPRAAVARQSPAAADPWPSVSARPPPLPAGPILGVPRLDFEADKPGVTLRKIVTYDPSLSRSSLPQERFVCDAPCDQLVDARGGEDFFFGGVEGRTSTFSLAARDGEVRARVKAGNARLVTVGGVGVGLGALALLIGGVTLLSGAGRTDTTSGRDTLKVGGVVVGAGAGAFGIGLALAFGFRTTYELSPPASTIPLP